MLYFSSSIKYDIFETYPLLELQMEELVPYFCKMAMVTNGYLNLDAFGRQVTIRIEILTILAFKLCMNCLRLAAPELFFSSSKLITRFRVLVIKDSGTYLQKGFGFRKIEFSPPFQIFLNFLELVSGVVWWWLLIPGALGFLWEPSKITEFLLVVSTGISIFRY